MTERCPSEGQGPRPGGAGRRARHAVLALCLVPLFGALAAVALAAQGDTELISRQSESDGGAGADGESIEPSVSDSGRYVAFESEADNLSGADRAGSDIFVRDVEAGRTTLVSRRSDAAGGAGASDDSARASISASGRYVAFDSVADNLSGTDQDRYRNVYVRDTEAGTTTLVSRATGGAAANGFSKAPSISASGRYVVFESHANNLSRRDDNRWGNVFVRDTEAGTTTLVSRRSAAAGGAGADDGSFFPVVSDSGGHVAFVSRADNLSRAHQEISTYDVYVRDVEARTTELVSRRSASAGGAGGRGTSFYPSISASGRYVAFDSSADNLGGGEDGIFVRDRETERTTLVSRQSDSDGGEPADDFSFDPSISDSGRYVAFNSYDDDLSDDDEFLTSDIYVRDTEAGTTTLASRKSAGDGGQAADSESYESAISGSGRFVSFQSYAENLSDADSAITDVFRHDVLGP